VRDDLKPEELWQGLTQGSRDYFSDDQILDFLNVWSDADFLVEDLDHFVENDRFPIRPEQVFEHLAESGNYYTIWEILGMAEEISNVDWSRRPVFSGTGDQIDVSFGDIVEVPGESGFSDLSESYFGRTQFEDGEKDIWMIQHQDYFQFGVSPLSTEELTEVFSSFEALAPSHCLHEVDYGEETYNLDSEDLNYFFEFKGDIDQFEDEIYRIESNYRDFALEASKIPGSQAYEVSAFSWRKTDTPIEAIEPVLRPEIESAMKTKLMLQYIDEMDK